MNESLSNLFLSKAWDSIGIYPKSIISGGVTKQRTEWQEGWNACSMAIINRCVTLEDWYGSLDESLKPTIAYLFEADVLDVIDVSDKVRISLNMNDTFCYACADCEEVSITDIPLIKQLYDKWGWDGLIAWASQKRQQEPIKERKTDKYKEAVKWLYSSGL